MKMFKKSVCFFIALLFVFTSIPFAFGEGNAETKSDVIEVIVKTNKEKYATASTAKVTVSVTNTGSKPLYNVNTQILFDQLTPVKEKKNTTEKHVNCLNPGDSFDFSYRAILNSENFDLGFFNKGLLFLSGLFNKAYYVEAKDHSGSGITVNKYKTTVTFGKYTAENIIELAYSTSEGESNNTAAVIATTAAPTTVPTTATQSYHHEEHHYDPPRTTRPHHTEPKPTKPRYTEPRTTKPVYTEPQRPEKDNTTTTKYKPTETYSAEARAYSAYISFLESNRSSIDKIDVADINGDGIFDLVIQKFDYKVAVYSYSDQYGMNELYSAGKGKGDKMDVYYSTSQNLIVATSADTGGATYKVVEFHGMSATVTSELRRNNGKHEQGCYLDGREIPIEECDNIIASYPNKYFVVEGNVSQAISVLQREM